MGQNICADHTKNRLPGPDRKKHSSDGGNASLGMRYARSSMQGWRDSQEDCSFAMSSLGSFIREDPETSGSDGQGWDETALFGVMDGHGGEQVSRFCERHLPATIARGSSSNVKESLYSAYMRMDEMLVDPERRDELRSLIRSEKKSSKLQSPEVTGSTAVVCCLRRSEIFVANAGDCRAVFCRAGDAIDMSVDHVPNGKHELARITKAGGRVIDDKVGNGKTIARMNGDLSVSRAIGDLMYKQDLNLAPSAQLISAEPDIQVMARDPEDEFMLLACDGIWNVMSSEEAVDFVSRRLKATCGPFAKRPPLTTIVEDLLDACISPDLELTDGWGGDNMTAILILFTRMPEAEATEDDASEDDTVSFNDSD